MIRCGVQCAKCDATAWDMSSAEMKAAGWETPVFYWRSGGWDQTAHCPQHVRWWSYKYWLNRRNAGLGSRIGRISIFLTPGYSWCGRCKTTNQFVETHTTWFAVGIGACPLCELCWGEITAAQRLPYYESLFSRWGADYANWLDIEAAVLSGK